MTFYREKSRARTQPERLHLEIVSCSVTMSKPKSTLNKKINALNVCCVSSRHELLTWQASGFRSLVEEESWLNLACSQQVLLQFLDHCCEALLDPRVWDPHV